MQISNDIHAFIWESMVENNCNTYLIDGPTKILIDPGHIKHFGHVRKGLETLDLDLKDLGIIICPTPTRIILSPFNYLKICRLW